MRFLLQKSQLKAIKQHIESKPAQEVCGLVGGMWRPYPNLAIAHTVIPARNIDHHPEVRYTIDPQTQIKAITNFEKQGWELVGVYHSHPQGPARPSPTDIAEAHYPDVAYLIGTPAGELSAWHIKKGQVQEIVLEIVSDSDE